MEMVFEIALTAAGFILFAFLHSVLAKVEVKRAVFTRWPGIIPHYRVIYNLLSLAALTAWYFFAPFPAGNLYIVPYPWNLLMHLVQLVGLVGFIYSLQSVNLKEFMGVNQRSNDTILNKDAREELVTDGLYGIVRHPLYTSSIVILVFHPYMSMKMALIAVLFTLYFWIGSYYEEKNLLKQFGSQYERYREEVPRLIPKIPLF